MRKFRISVDTAGCYFCSRQRTFSFLTVAVGLFLALATAWTCRADRPSDLRNDAAGYYSLATQLLQNQRYDPAGYWPPGYPAFVAAVRLVGGDAPVSVYVAQSFLFAAILVLAGRITSYVTESETVSVLTQALCAVWPPFLMAVNDVLSELFASFLLASALWFLIIAIRSGKLVASISAGLCLGLTVLTKSALLVLLPVWGLCVTTFRGSNVRRALLGLVLLASASAVIAPWTVRNYLIWGEIIPVSTGGGFNFWLGNWPERYHRVWKWEEYPDDIRSQIDDKTPPERDRVFFREGVRCITEDPVRAVGIFAIKFSELWLGGIGRDPKSSVDAIPAIGRFGVPVQSAVCVPLFVLMILGWRGLPNDARRRALSVVVVMVVTTLAYVAIVVAPTRHVIPLQFYQMMFVSAFLVQTATKLRRRVTPD